MSRAMERRDARLIDQSARSLRRVSDWLTDLRTLTFDGRAHDLLGELIHEVDKLEAELDPRGGAR